MRELILAGIALTVVLASTAGCERAQPARGFGVLGDSESDEYQADDKRGGEKAATTLNWVELLVRYRGLNVGVWGRHGEPRRTGYAYNWARTGARAADIVTGGQASGLAQQVAAGQVSIALLMVGENDFSAGNGTYEEIYDGSLTANALTSKIDKLVGNIQQALDIVRSAGKVDLFVANIADVGASPLFQSQFADASGRARVTDAIAAANRGIQAVADERGVRVINMHGLAVSLFRDVDAAGNLRLGGELISLVSSGDEWHHALLGDNSHAGTVLSGMLANYYLDYFNAAGLGIGKFTDQELLSHAAMR